MPVAEKLDSILFCNRLAQLWVLFVGLPTERKTIGNEIGQQPAGEIPVDIALTQNF